MCSVSQGTPPLFFTWSKNEHAITNQADRLQLKKVADSISLLIIDSITKDDTGNYSCTVRNAFGEDSLTARLLIRGKNAFYLLKISNIE